MKQKYIIPALLTLTLFITSCVEDIEYDGPGSKCMLVANCIAGDGTVPVFHMSRSRLFLEYYTSNDDFKSGVQMDIDINGTTQSASYDYDFGGYTDHRFVYQGDIISVSATHPDYGHITATDTVPYAQNCIINGYVQKYSHTNTISEAFDDYQGFDDSAIDSSWVVELDIQGRPDTADFYMLKIYPFMQYKVKGLWTAGYDTLSKSLYYKIPTKTKMLLGQTDATTAILEETEEDSQFEWGATTYIFSDEFIKDGSKLSFEVLLEKPDTIQTIYMGFDPSDPGSYTDYSGAEYCDSVTYGLSVQLYVLSNSYYLYRKTVADYDDSSFLSEPVTIIHNIKGGIGILATYAEKITGTQIVRKWK